MSNDTSLCEANDLSEDVLIHSRQSLKLTCLLGLTLVVSYLRGAPVAVYVADLRGHINCHY